MSFSSWLRNRSAKLAPRGPARHPRAGARFRPGFEALEDRVVPSSGPTILTVNDLNDSPKGNTLRNAILQADKATNKTFEIDISVVGTITLRSSLPDLANNISIVGLGTSKTIITCDAALELQSPFRIVTADAGWTVGLSGMMLEQGNAGTGNGGAIDNFANLTLTNCELDSNLAANGGAVENEAGASLTATGAIFTGNQAGSYAGSTPGYGGGIDNNGTLTTSSAFFISNTATDGGGINNNGALTVGGNCAFGGNSATSQSLPDYGGGIDNNGTGTVQVSGSLFNNNKADNHGGGIFNAAGHTLVVTNCNFQYNHNLVNAVVASFPYNGGAIENAGMLTVSSSQFDHNSANTSFGSGGAISNLGTAVVNQGTFTYNSGELAGAVINWAGASLTLSDCPIRGAQLRRMGYANRTIPQRLDG
jgi:hypothetical protein